MSNLATKILTKDGVLLQQVVCMPDGTQYQHRYEYDDFGLVQVVTSELKNDNWIPIVMVEIVMITNILYHVYSEFIEGKWIELSKSKG